jgi:hypothetical protein
MTILSGANNTFQVKIFRSNVGQHANNVQNQESIVELSKSSLLKIALDRQVQVGSSVQTDVSI